MSQAGTLLVTFDASQTCFGGQTPDLMVALDSQTVRTHSTSTVASLAASGVPFQKVVDIAKDLEII
ncbi:hypothetical protein H5410_040796 [Solanum commersonii]|uniref:Uncharacterized protein n=1 Tax=Solanum commersonii TaxID=4109 RepID=A0A9J5XR62_SOLCO|nr:hypothetical protein H5410_040796 [Solanum commersonii]